MTYKMNEKQYESFLALGGAERHAHFISKVADWQKLWGVRNDEGWLFPIIEGEFEYFPVWPHPEYAQRITDMHFPGHKAIEIQLSDFLDDWLVKLEKESIKVGVFPNKDWSIWVVEPNDIAALIREELTWYE